jgi:hypothetical protein
VPKADLGHSCWSAGYVLGHCEGFRVETCEGRLGYVDEVVRAPEGGEPLALRVRTMGRGGSSHVLVMIEDVLELHAEAENIDVRTRSSERHCEPGQPAPVASLALGKPVRRARSPRGTVRGARTAG